MKSSPFKIPATDLGRAMRFYNQVLGLNTSDLNIMVIRTAMVSCEEVVRCGKVVIPKASIGEHGFGGLFIDTGDRVCLYSKS